MNITFLLIQLHTIIIKLMPTPRTNLDTITNTNAIADDDINDISNTGLTLTTTIP